MELGLLRLSAAISSIPPVVVRWSSKYVSELGLNKLAQTVCAQHGSHLLHPATQRTLQEERFILHTKQQPEPDLKANPHMPTPSQTVSLKYIRDTFAVFAAVWLLYSLRTILEFRTEVLFL